MLQTVYYKQFATGLDPSFAEVYKIKKSSVCARSLSKLRCNGTADATK